MSSEDTDDAQTLSTKDKDLESDTSLPTTKLPDESKTSTAKQFFLNCYYTNANSIMNKGGEFEANIDMWKPKIIGVSESWCEASVLDSEISLPDYTLFREDRKSGTIGGVLLYIHKDLQAVKCDELNDPDYESALWCQVKVDNTDTLLIGVCYRSPNSTADNNEKLLDQLRRVEKVNATHVLIMGDFNFKEIDWTNQRVNAGDEHPASVFFDHVDVTQDAYLIQHVTFPTRHRESQRSSLLDLVLTNEEFMVENLHDIAPIGKSDHVGMVWTYVCNSGITTSDENQPKKNFKKADYSKMKDYFNTIDWDKVMDGLSCEEAWQVLKSKYDIAVDDNVPLKKTNSKYKPQWMKSSVRKSIKRKHALYKKYRKTKCYHDYEEYKKQNNRTRQTVRKAQAKFEKKLMEEFKENPKAFYGYVRSKQKVKAGISQLERSEGGLTDTDQEAAEILSDFFQSVFTGTRR